MARGRSANRWRWIHPSYYLKRPKRLALLFIAFVLGSFGVWDRQTLVREHEEEISKLNSELSQLHSQVRELKAHLGDAGESIVEKFSESSKKSAVRDDPIDVERREKVKEAMLHAWNSYVKYAWGQDELQPQTKNGVNSFGGLGLTIVDALDTLYIMDLHNQFQKAREWVANSLDFNKDYEASVFETNIRVVGGLLSTYDLSGDKIFLEKARDIADRLLPAWDTPSGIPYNRINLALGNAHNLGWTGGDSVLADSATEQLEFIALSQRTGDPKYRQKEEISKLNSELSRLHSQVRELKAHLGDAGESIVEQFGESSKKSAVRDDPIDVERREKVKEAMLHAWNSYVKYAWGQDELQPQTKNGVNSFGGLGLTIVDALDTLYIMGLHDQFQKGREWVANSLDFNKDYEASVFETRVVGGLLSAYDLSGDKIFLEKTRDIADRLLPAWDTLSGIPYNRINLALGNAHNFGWTGGDSVLADSATEQLEFIALSPRTGDPKYRQKVERVIKQIQKTFPRDGLLPIFINPHSGTPSYPSTITFGAMGDSFYEYLLKVWIQGNKTEAVQHYREMWEMSIEGLLSLVRKTTPSSFSYLCEKSGDSLTDKMDELACFAPGMLALGSFGYGPEKAEKFMSLAKELAWTCYNFYQSTPTKLAGENYFFQTGQDMNVGVSWNILRPETIESLVYLWRLTGNKTYQEWGWNIFQAFEKNSRIESGYVGLKDVNTGAKDNLMQSFFLAETLKYLYLLFSPPSVISFDEWVFNTEGHPLRIVPKNWGTLADADTKLKPKPLDRFFGRKRGKSEYE